MTEGTTSPLVTEEQQQQNASAAAETTALTQGEALQKKYVSVWYHEADYDLVKHLDDYLQPLYRRLLFGGRVERNYFDYRIAVPKAPPAYTGTAEIRRIEYEQALAKHEQAERTYQQKQIAAVSCLKQSFLFVPCVSNSFMKSFSDDSEALRTIFAQPAFQIMPIVLRPTEGEVNQTKPLCAYEGYHLETACKEIAAVIETIVRASGLIDQQEHTTSPVELLLQSPQTIQAVIPSQRNPTMDALVAMLAPIKALLEETSTQVVESRQLAIAARRQEESVTTRLTEAECRLTELQQQVEQPTKKRRWFFGREA